MSVPNLARPCFAHGQFGGIVKGYANARNASTQLATSRMSIRAAGSGVSPRSCVRALIAAVATSLNLSTMATMSTTFGCESEAGDGCWKGDTISPHRAVPSPTGPNTHPHRRVESPLGTDCTRYAESGTISAPVTCSVASPSAASQSRNAGAHCNRAHLNVV